LALVDTYNVLRSIYWIKNLRSKLSLI
jgi:hypothetical protein